MRGAAFALLLAALPAQERAAEDWLVHAPAAGAVAGPGPGPDEVQLDNGLIRRVLRLAPNAATVAFDDLMTGASLLRGVSPEARLVLDGTEYPVGGLLGQEEYGYLLPEWLDAMTADPAAFRYTGHRIGPLAARFPWKRVRWSEERPWPPPGVTLALDFAAPAGPHAGVTVTVHYAIYDGLPLLCKWFTLANGSGKAVRLDAFTSEILAAVEPESDVEDPGEWLAPPIHVETDYSFGGFTPKSANAAVRWVPDPRHLSQVNYARRTPNLLQVGPPRGPGVVIEAGGRLESFRTWELVFDSTDRERRGLARRRMMRTIAPWATENPILMHVRSAQPAAVRLALEQCAAVGFEMVILTFGSGFSMENRDPAYAAGIRELADHAHGLGVELGGYSLLSSRRISDEHDVIDFETGKPGGARFGNAPCLESAWGQAYFAQLRHFLEQTGLDVLEHDGSYPGDFCASNSHPGHAGLADSQWRQWERIAGFYRWCRGRGVYLNVPDWYFLNGSNKTGMGYREVNWSLPRARQLLLARQNIYDGTWIKAPSMGWMFVPLVEYHGGGAAATLEPLSEHLEAYEQHLINNFSAGVQACYRGPRLYDSPRTREVVVRWVSFYKQHRAILDSDVIHLRRADGRDLDGLLHVNPGLAQRGLLAVHNPTEQPLRRVWRVPLYYTGLDRAARVLPEGRGPGELLELDRGFGVELEIEVPARGMRWFVFLAP